MARPGEGRSSLIRCDDFGFGNSNADIFSRMFWKSCEKKKWCRVLWILYRLLLPPVFISWVPMYCFIEGVESIIDGLVTCSWWTYYVFIMYVTVAAVNLLLDRPYKDRRNGTYEEIQPRVLQDSQFRHKIQWLLFGVAIDSEFVICIVYWSLLFQNIYDGTVLVVVEATILHALPSVVGLIDIWFGAYHVRLLHFIYPACLGTSWFIFAVIFWAAGGTHHGNSYIYFFIDFDNNPGLAILMLFVLDVLIIVLHIFVWGIASFKAWLSTRYNTELEPVNESLLLLSEDENLQYQAETNIHGDLRVT